MKIEVDLVPQVLHKTWNFLSNAWRFRKSLANFVPYDYACNLDLFRESLEYTLKKIKESSVKFEGEEELLIHFQRVIRRLRRITTGDVYVDIAEHVCNDNVNIAKKISQLELVDMERLIEDLQRLPELWI